MQKSMENIGTGKEKLGYGVNDNGKSATGVKDNKVVPNFLSNQKKSSNK